MRGRQSLGDSAPCSCSELPPVLLPFVHSARPHWPPSSAPGEVPLLILLPGKFPPRHAHGSLSTLLGHSRNVTSTRSCLATLSKVATSHLCPPHLFSASPLFLCSPCHLAHWVLLDSELSEGICSECFGHCYSFCTQHRLRSLADPQLPVEKLNDEVLPSLEPTLLSQLVSNLACSCSTLGW